MRAMDISPERRIGTLSRNEGALALNDCTQRNWPYLAAADMILRRTLSKSLIEQQEEWAECVGLMLGDYASICGYLPALAFCPISQRRNVHFRTGMHSHGHSHEVSRGCR